MHGQQNIKATRASRVIGPPSQWGTGIKQKEREADHPNSLLREILSLSTMSVAMSFFFFQMCYLKTLLVAKIK